MIGRSARLRPGLGTIVDVACVKAKVRSRIPFPAGQQQGDGKENERSDPDPGPKRNVACRNRLRLARTIGSGLPETRGKRALTNPAHLGSVRVRMRSR